MAVLETLLFARARIRLNLVLKAILSLRAYAVSAEVLKLGIGVILVLGKRPNIRLNDWVFVNLLF
jgi:hypothetical protein